MIYHRLPFQGAPRTTVGPDGEPVREILLEAEVTLIHGRIVDAWSIYPSTIVPARYGMTYTGASWLAFPTSPMLLETEPFWSRWNGGDIPYMEFYDEARAENWPIGYGCTPDEAYGDLLDRVCTQVGVEIGSPPSGG